MSSTKIIMVMSLMILVFLFGGLALGFILSTGSFLDNQSARVQINDRNTMQQLVMYNSLIAYACDSRSGGYGGDWASWKEYKDYAKGTSELSFDDLRDSMSTSNLVCSGTPQKLPTDGIGGEMKKAGKKFLDVGKPDVGSWGNDQDGKYSKMRFEVTKNIKLGTINPATGKIIGCFVQEGGPGGDTVYIWADPDSAAATTYNDDYSGDSMKCVTADPTDKSDGTSGDSDNAAVTGGAWGGPTIAVHLMGYGFDITDFHRKATHWRTITLKAGGAVSAGKRYIPIGGDDDVDVDIEAYEYALCEGAKGYIQTNTGGPHSYKTGPDLEDTQDPGYTPDNPPGEPGEKVGNHPVDYNNIHPFIVITDPGNVAAPGTCEPSGWS